MCSGWQCTLWGPLCRVHGLACGASDVTGLCHRFGMWCVRCHRFMSQVWHVVRQMSQVWHVPMASVRQMSQVWHVVRQMSQVWHVSWRLCVRCHGVCASDVMASVRQMSSHIMLKFGMCQTGLASVRQMSEVWRLCVRCHGVRASDVMSRNVKVWHVPKRFGVCASDVTGLACVNGVCASDVTGLACVNGVCASDVSGLTCVNGVCVSDVTGLACANGVCASDVTGLACANGIH